VTAKEAGQKIKAKYPEYAEVPDEEIGQWALDKGLIEDHQL
jgi:hypothetical protein